ncbi:MAG TPA: hypothetical protein VF508_06595 [Pyrinomonadaceae bacterium]|jgi:hypothetical protein
MTRFLLCIIGRLVVTTVVLLCSAGGLDADARQRGAAQVARVGQEFKVRVGRAVTFEGESLRLRFAAVASDSRCPANVTCVWAGNAEVLIEVGAKGGRVKRVLRLNTNATGRGAVEGRYRNYTLKLVGLSPRPRDGRKTAAGEYTATLLVVKD